MNYKHIASSLEKSWARPIDPGHVKAIVEATLSARVEVINENNGIKNDIKGAKSLILLNVHILLCIFAEFKHSHDCSLVNSLTWNITGAIDQKQEAQERKKMLLRQRKAKKAKSVPGAGDPSTADAAVAEERFVMLSTCCCCKLTLKGNNEQNRLDGAATASCCHIRP